MELTINELAKCLGLPLTTVERWIRQGRIPIQKRGTVCIFKESALEKWAGTHNLVFSLERSEISEISYDLEPENLLPAVERGGVYYDVTGKDVKTVLKSAVDKIPFLSDDAKDELHERLMQREEMTSTGIGKGVAIPHPRSPMSGTIVNPFIFTCFLEKPVNFGAIDDKPVFVMFILLSPNVKIHLHLLSRLSFCLRDDKFVEFLKNPPEQNGFFSKIAEFDSMIT